MTPARCAVPAAGRVPVRAGRSIRVRQCAAQPAALKLRDRDMRAFGGAMESFEAEVAGADREGARLFSGS